MQQPHVQNEEPQRIAEKTDPKLGDILGIPANGQVRALNSDDPKEEQRLIQAIKDNYNKDPLTRTMLNNPDNHKKHFRVTNGLI
jgi:hypothetical protein